MEIQRNISDNKNQEIIGQKLKILVESREGDFYIGRSYRDAPEVDGEVLIDINNSTDLILGDFYFAEVYDANEYDLFAKVI